MIYCGRRIPSNAQSISPCPNFTCVCALQPAEINQISLLYTCCDEPMENKLFDGKGIACAPSSRPHQSYVVSQSTLPITRLTMEQRLPWDVLSGLQLLYELWYNGCARACRSFPLAPLDRLVTLTCVSNSLHALITFLAYHCINESIGLL